MAQQDASVRRVIETQAHVVLHSDPCNLLLTKWLSVYWSYGIQTQLRLCRPDNTVTLGALLKGKHPITKNVSSLQRHEQHLQQGTRDQKDLAIN